MRYGKRFFKWLWALLLKPIKMIATLVFTVIILIDKFALKTFHESVTEFKKLITAAQSVSDKSAEAKTEGREKFFKKMVNYAKKAYFRYKKAFMYVLNIALPVVCFVFLLNVCIWRV